MSFSRAAALIALALACPPISSAHHSFSALFEMERTIEIGGRVTEIRWLNPHIKLHVEQPEGGETWEVEAGPINLLSRMGIERDLIEVGDTIRVRGNPGRKDPRALWVMNILLPDNTEVLANPTAQPYWGASAIGDSTQFFEAGPLAPRTGADQSIFKVWSTLITSMPLPQGPAALTAAGRQAQAAYDRGDVPFADCEPPGMPLAMGGPYPIQLVDQGERILIRMESYDQERIVHMSAPAVEPEPSPLGFSLGRREGDVLVVETSNIDYHTFGDLGPAQSRQSRVVERFKLSSDGTELFYDATMTDPVNLAEPWTWGGSYLHREGEQLRRWNCGVQ